MVDFDRSQVSSQRAKNYVFNHSRKFADVVGPDILCDADFELG